MTRQSGHSDSITALRSSLAQLTADASDASLPTIKRKKLEAQIKQVISELTELLAGLDPTIQPKSIFDPSNPKVVGRFVALAMVAQDRHPLADIPKFYGSGVYAIYYTGSFEAYQRLSGTETPIYVGQAAPAISNARNPTEQGAKLSERLSEHRKNIERASSTLDLSNFSFRSLVVQSGWETAAEDYLIELFRPVWNNETKLVYGIGKHGDSATTRTNKRSPWDTLHPGRPWAAPTIEDAKSINQINSELVVHFNAHPPYADLGAVMNSFIEELRQG